MTFESRFKGNERAVISEDVCGKKVSSRAEQVQWLRSSILAELEVQ